MRALLKKPIGKSNLSDSFENWRKTRDKLFLSVLSILSLLLSHLRQCLALACPRIAERDGWTRHFGETNSTSRSISLNSQKSSSACGAIKWLIKTILETTDPSAFEISRLLDDAFTRFKKIHPGSSRVWRNGQCSNIFKWQYC